MSIKEEFDGFSPKTREFLAELVALCEKHKVVLSTSGYDNFQVWDMDKKEDALYSGVEDCTSPWICKDHPNAPIRERFNKNNRAHNECCECGRSLATD